jgi:hypothetical protein
VRYFRIRFLGCTRFRAGWNRHRSSPCLLFPTGGWLILVRPDLSGMSFFAGCMLPSGPSPCSGLSPPPSTIPDKTPHRHPAGFPFPQSPSAYLPRSSFRHLGSDLTLGPGFPFRASLVVYLMSGLSSGQGRWDLLGSLTHLLPLMRRPSDSGGPPHPHPSGCFVWPSGTLTRERRSHRTAKRRSSREAAGKCRMRSIGAS